MSQMQTNNPMYNIQTGTPLYNYANNPLPQMQPQQQTVSVASPQMSQIYQYPQTSLYGAPAQQPASGVNIHIYNPSAIGGPSSNSTANATYAMPSQPVVAQAPAPAVNPQQNMTIANTPISDQNNTKTEVDSNKKTKKIVELTDDYIKTLESYIKSPDKEIRKSGITQLIQRFDEDDSRYDDPALTALLNIALQDPVAHNRVLAMTPVAAGTAHGDQNTIDFLQKLTASDKEFGQEAKMANNALLKAAETKITVPDNSPDKPKKEEESK